MKLTFLAALLLAPFSALHAADAKKPNVIFILADDLGWSDTTLYGQTKFHETPNLERLARRGMILTNAYTANSLCSPTRASIMTGLYPGRIGITAPVCHGPEMQLAALMKDKAPIHQPALHLDSATRLKTEYHTLAETFHDAGYATGHFGKWHLGPEPYSPLQQGFDVDLPHFPGPGPAGSYVAPWKFPGGFAGKPGEHIEDRMASEAVRFLKANRNRPFFLNYWTFSVHAPFDAKQELIAKYRRRVNPADEQRCPTYGAMVQSLDENVGRLLDALDELKLADNTIVVFFSDNGGNTYSRVDGESPTSNRPLRGGKATIYEGGTRVPCVVVWPGQVKPGSRSDALLSSVDWYPTLIDMAGVKTKSDVKFDGVSQTPALLGTGVPRETAFCYFPHYTPATGAKPSIWVRRDDWKLIRFYCDNPDQTDRFELYDLKHDVGETNNLAAAQPATVKELNALIDGFHRDTCALVPAKNPAYDPQAKAPPVQEKKAKAKSGKSAKSKDPRTEHERAGDEDLTNTSPGNQP